MFTGSTKLLGLKSCGAFNNPHYYNPARRTITKPLMALSRRQLAEELDALAFLALHSNRSLIVPNVLIGEAPPPRTTSLQTHLRNYIAYACCVSDDQVWVRQCRVS